MSKRMKCKITMLLSLVLIISILLASGNVVFASETMKENNLQKLITRLEEADGTIPDDFTLDDMNLFLEQAPPAIVEAIMDNISRHAIPVPLEETNVNTKQKGQRSTQYRSYDFATRSEQLLSFDALDSGKINPNSGNNITKDMDSISASRAYPDHWIEESPQSYYDTRTNVQILIKTKNGTGYIYQGSGFMVSDDTVVTAAHNIFSPNYSGWCDYLIIKPSHSENNDAPYGLATSTMVYIGNFPDTNYIGDDWGVAKMNKSFSIGSLNMTTNNFFEWGRELRVQGYPGNLNTGERNENLYLATGKVILDDSAYLKYTDALVSGGMSGGPVMYKDNNGTWVAGGIIHGYNDQASAFCAFDDNLYNLIQSYL